MQHSSCPTFMKEIHDEISPILLKETMMYCTEIVILCDCKNIAADVNPWMMEIHVFVFFHTSMCFERTKAPLSEGQVELVCPKADPPLERHAATHAFAASLLDQDLSGCHNLEGNTSSISKILAEVTTPPLQQTSSPFVRRPAWTWPSPLHIRDGPVQQSLLLNVLRSKRCEKKNNETLIQFQLSLLRGREFNKRIHMCQPKLCLHCRCLPFS